MPTLKNILVKKMISDVEVCYFETFCANASKFNMVLLYKEPSRIPEIVEMTDIKPEDIKEQLKASNSNITFAGGLPLTWMKEVRVRRSITATQPLHFDPEDSEQSASLTREKRVADTEESQGEISSTITQLEAENVAKSRSPVTPPTLNLKPGRGNRRATSSRLTRLRRLRTENLRARQVTTSQSPSLMRKWMTARAREILLPVPGSPQWLTLARRRVNRRHRSLKSPSVLSVARKRSSIFI